MEELEPPSSASRVNMALKLDMWRSAKQTPAPPPLRPVVFSSIQQRKVSGYNTAVVAAGQSSSYTSVAMGKKTFSRLKSPSSMESLQSIVSTSKPIMSPKSMTLNRKRGSSEPAPTIFGMSNVCSNLDDDTKENSAPVKEQLQNRYVTEVVEHILPTPSTCVDGDNEMDFTTAFHRSSPGDRRNLMLLTIDVDNIYREVVGMGSSEVSMNDESIVQESDAVEVAEIKQEASTMDVVELLRRNRDLELRLREADDRAMCVQEELNAMMFLNSVQEQQLLELDQTSSAERLHMHESLSNRTRKHKAEVKKLNAEHANYENQANQMITQMTEQMEMLQQMAMGRIESLVSFIRFPSAPFFLSLLLSKPSQSYSPILPIQENELMTERHRAEGLQQEVFGLRRNAVLMSHKTTASREMGAQEEENDEGENDEEDNDDEEDDDEENDVDESDEEANEGKANDEERE